ncbi:hypothetical protein LOTGIDRAFT_165905 [Lottia gigantea]|uniref:G-protein coupled receptors family 1 profile domain-containing protein n=1 Tax=Lottia gigantea TaxID=225164 RepID=V3ZUW6_LOTGI|nr:hypothetical protein LOTGIDRAFT_165905 [Lottia gigantea]ESO88162.1 hypothetical protein LOTGIDRAFT_165905 [Lottia gigantea]
MPMILRKCEMNESVIYDEAPPEPITNITNNENFITVMEYNIPFAIAIHKCVTPIWYIIGGIGNIISARIWLHPRMKACNMSANYLAGLAIADFIYLSLHVFNELENPWNIGTLDLPVWCELWNVLYMSVDYMCVLLVLAFTVERFLSVCYPFKSERFSRKSRSPKVIILLSIAAVLFGLPQAYFWEVSASDKECFVRYSELMAGENSFYNIYTWGSEMVVFGIIPLLVLSLNICVLLKIKTVGKLNFSESRTSHLKYNLVTTTITLLWVSFYLIVTTLPVTITFAIQNSMSLGPAMPVSQMASNAAWRTYFAYYSARIVIREVCMSHHSCNVFIYCATSRRFLKHTKELVFGPLVCGAHDDESCTRQYPTPLLKNKNLIINHSHSQSRSRSQD